MSYELAYDITSILSISIESVEQIIFFFILLGCHICIMAAYKCFESAAVRVGIVYGTAEYILDFFSFLVHLAILKGRIFLKMIFTLAQILIILIPPNKRMQDFMTILHVFHAQISLS